MNLDLTRLKTLLQNKDSIKFFTVLMTGVALTALVFFVLVKPWGGKMRQVKSEAEARSLLAKQYERFQTEFSDKLNAQRNEAASIISLENLSAPLADSEQSALEFIGKKAREARIPLERLTPLQSDTQKKWDISFRAGYPALILFMRLLESRFKVEQFQISGGGAQNIHAAGIILSIIPAPPGDSAADTGKDIFTLYQEVGALVTEITAHQRGQGVTAAARDPMYYPDTIFPVVRVVERKAAENEIKRPQLGIEDIFWDADMPLVSIEGRVMKVGDTIRGMEIIKIREKSIDVKWQSRVFTYAFQKKGG